MIDEKMDKLINEILNLNLISKETRDSNINMEMREYLKKFICKIRGHIEVESIQMTKCELKEPSDPVSREGIIKIKEVKCKRCGVILKFLPQGIVYDSKDDRG